MLAWASDKLSSASCQSQPICNNPIPLQFSFSSTCCPHMHRLFHGAGQIPNDHMPVCNVQMSQTSWRILRRLPSNCQNQHHRAVPASVMVTTYELAAILVGTCQGDLGCFAIWPSTFAAYALAHARGAAWPPGTQSSPCTHWLGKHLLVQHGRPVQVCQKRIPALMQQHGSDCAIPAAGCPDFKSAC